MYCHDGRFKLARELRGVLATRQRNGSWQYEDERSGEERQYEDSLHLAMMIHSFREAARLGGGDTSAMVTKAVKVLKRLNRLRAKDRVGWNWPYVAVAARGFERSLATRALWMTRVFSLRNRNFRVRAIAAWALARLGFGGSEGAPRETGEEEKEDASQRIHEDIGGLRRLWKR
jgi:hypothetical protein